MNMRMPLAVLAVCAVLGSALAAQPGDEMKKIPDYSLKARSEVPLEHTWKIEDLYASAADWQAEKEAVTRDIAAIDEAAKGWTGSAAAMKRLLDLVSSIQLRGARLYAYASHQSNTDMANTRFQAMLGEIRTGFVQLGAKLAFMRPDILALGGERFAAFLQAEPGLAPYRFGVEGILREKAHVLPSEQQRIASLTGLFSGVPADASGMLNNVEVPRPEVTLADGSKVQLDQAAYQRLRGSREAADRSLVMKAYWENQKKFENTFAILQDGAIKSHLFAARIRNHADCLAARLFAEDISPEVYQQLIRQVRAYLPALHRYLALKQKMLGLPQFRYEDVYASAVPAVDKTFPFAEAQRLITDALKPMGPEYAGALRRAFAERWMDLYPNKGKESGAYSGGVYGVHPYIKLNYNGDYDAVSTAAHELGHAMHSYFSDKAQPFPTADYTTFVAEIASTFNEHLLMHHLLKKEKDDLFKLYILDSYLDGFRGTLFRQTLFAEFELAMHRRVEEGQTLISDWLNAAYLELTREYYGHEKGVCRVDDYIQSEWSGIPHFYMDYYVFQYSTGIIASLALSERVAKGDAKARDGYLEVLKAGGSDYPLNILKKGGVDMTRPEPYAAALKRFDDLVGEMEKIVARLQKQKQR